MKEHLGTVDDFFNYTDQLDGPCIFRGHPTARFPLLPSIGRQYRGKPDLNLERDLLDQFKLKASRFVPSPPQTELDWLILARHYGLRTKLLDWTWNKFVALYFALQERKNEECFPISIYITRKPRLASYFYLRNSIDTLNDPIFFEPPHIDGRIANQSALFSYHPNPFEPFEEVYVERFSIFPHEEQISRIQRHLTDVGVSHATIYPGLEGICRDINDNPSFLPKQLIVDHAASGAWKSIPSTWAARPWSETKRLLIQERTLKEFLNFNHSSEIVGIPLEENCVKIGSLFGFDSQNNELLIHNKTSLSLSIRNGNSGEFDSVQVEKQVIDAYFPAGDVTFRTQRPLPT